MLLYLIRHGQSTNNAGLPRVVDPVLTDLGIAQAQYAATSLRKEGLTHLFASPMRRALQTAAKLSEATNLPVTVAPEFCEVGGLRQPPGLTRSEVELLCPNCQPADSVTEAGWWFGEEETYSQGYARASLVSQNLWQLARREPKANVGLITHGTYSSFLIRAFMEIPFLGEGDSGHVRFNHGNTAVTLLDIEPGFFQLRYQNRTEHLPFDHITGLDDG